MKALSRKLQVQSPCPYQSYQSVPFHGHKKPKFLSG